MTRLIVGNLDAEIEMARVATPGPHPDVSPVALRRIASAATHLAVFAGPGDRLWLPGDPPPDPAARVLAWAETDTTAALRASTTTSTTTSTITTTIDELWRWHPTPAIARAANHRRFAFELAREHGWALPGARLIRDPREIDLSGSGPWVAKAPYSAAGRERVRETGPRLERILARFGELLLEPWVDRILDLGCSGIVGDRVTVFAPHRLENDARGVFRAVAIDDAATDWPAERAAVRDAAEIAGDALLRIGYRGPFTIDAYVHRQDGETRLQRMSELNARLTFGLVARAAAERTALPGGPFELRRDASI